MNNSVICPKTAEDILREKEQKLTKRPHDSTTTPLSPVDATLPAPHAKRLRTYPPSTSDNLKHEDASFSPPSHPYTAFKIAPDWSGNELSPSQPFSSTQHLSYASASQAPPTIFPSTAQMFVETPGPLSLANPKWGLRREVVLAMKSLGITSMYPWQSECLSLPGVLDATTNLVYTAPTSAGKSLVADILTIRTLLYRRKKVIIVLPYIAIVQEKTRFLKKALRNTRVEVRGHEGRRLWRGVNVVGFHSGAKDKLEWKVVDVAVCTIEKANAIVNEVVGERTVGELGAVVFDEAHMLADEHRGFILELLATKILCLQEEIQIVAMSATLKNVNQVADWLRAHAYECQYRPIPLEEHLVHDSTVFDYEGNTQRQLNLSRAKELKDPSKSAMVCLAIECVTDGHGVLVFCESRAKCEALANILRKYMPGVPEETLEARMEVVRTLATSPTGLDTELEKCVPRGVAFHHAGLTTEERDIIADAYDRGLVKVICCTATMAAGVNLPARRVIVYPKQGISFVSPAMFRQMRGRAGRKGKDTVGESYVVCRKEDLDVVRKLMNAPMPTVESSLLQEGNNIGLTRALLEIIATNLATEEGSIEMYFRSTLLHHVHPNPPELPGMLKVALDSLLNDGLITLENGVFAATKPGKATVLAGLSPQDGLFLHTELSTALKSFNLESDMHIIYHFTTIHLTASPFELDWKLLRDELENLDEASLRAALFVGVKPAFVNKMAQGASFHPKTPEEENTLRIHRRFYVSLMLRMLLQERPVHEVASFFGIARGFVQSLATTCRGFAATSATFCRAMGWTGLAVLLEHYCWRLEMGVREELVGLARVPYVKNRTARVFWENGLRTVEDVWGAGEERVAQLLWKAMPRGMRGDGEMAGKMKEMLRERAEVVVRGARRVWEREEVVIEEE